MYEFYCAENIRNEITLLKIHDIRHDFQIMFPNVCKHLAEFAPILIKN